VDDGGEVTTVRRGLHGESAGHGDRPCWCGCRSPRPLPLLTRWMEIQISQCEQGSGVERVELGE